MKLGLNQLRGVPAHELVALAGLEMSQAQLVILKAIEGAPLPRDEMRMFRKLTGTTGVLGVGGGKPNASGYREALLRCGRRSGKSTRVAAPLAVAALISNIEHLLGPGEVGRVLIVAPRRDQTKTILDAVGGLLELLGVVHERLAAGIRVPGLRVVVEVCTASDVAPRGPTCVCVIVDEAALLPFLPGSEGQDVELIAAIRPTLSTTGGRLIVVSTPWGRSGFHFDRTEELLGNVSGRAIAFVGPTWLLNPAHFPDEASAREHEPDPKLFAREWAAIPGDTDTSAFASSDLEACIDRGRRYTAPIRGVKYSCGYDEGGRQAARACVVTHRERRTTPAGTADFVVVDFVKRWPPGKSLDHDGVMRELASIAQKFGNATIYRDLFSGDAVESALKRHEARSVEISMAPGAQAARFHSLQALVETHRVRFVDDDDLMRELRGLREQMHQGGRLTYSKGGKKGSFDDLADALALSVEGAAKLPAAGGDGLSQQISFRRNHFGLIVGFEQVWTREVKSKDGSSRFVVAEPPPNTPAAHAARRRRWERGFFTPGDIQEFGDDVVERFARGDFD